MPDTSWGTVSIIAAAQDTVIEHIRLTESEIDDLVAYIGSL